MSNESKKTKAKSAANNTPDASGRVRLETADGAEMFDPATWVEPAADGSTKIEGTLTRAFVMVDTLGEKKGKPFRSAYVITDAQGFPWTVGEKAFFRRAIRKLRVGTVVELAFTKKEPMIDARSGEPDGRTIWRGDLFVIGGKLGTGALIGDMLAESHAELIEKGEHLPY